MANYRATLHIQEKYEHPVYGRIFDGWVDSKVDGVFGIARYAMTIGQAIAYKTDQEKRAFEWSCAPKISAETCEPIESTVTLDFEIPALQ